MIKIQSLALEPRLIRSSHESCINNIIVLVIKTLLSMESFYLLLCVCIFFRMRGVEEERRRRGKDEGGKGIRVFSNVKFKNRKVKEETNRD